VDLAGLIQAWHVVQCVMSWVAINQDRLRSTPIVNVALPDEFQILRGC
jgi:hypothetical protein